MSERYPGGIISKTAPTVSTSGAPGVWTLEQQAAYQKAGTWPFGGPFTYIEDVFSTYLYAGSGSSGQTITNGIDLSTQGGLVWIKNRGATGTSHNLTDTVRGATVVLNTNNTSAEYTDGRNINTFNTNGFSLLSDTSAGEWNYSGYNYVSWTFRKQAKFFDIVTYTGNGTTQTVSHNLGSLPGCIIAKRTDTSSDWIVWHKGNSTNLTSTITGLSINRTNSAYYSSFDVSGYMTSTSFNPAYMFDYSATYDANINGATYVAYIFAHNAGGFGTAGTDNVISCGSFTTDGVVGSGSVTLGYEPQWVIVKSASANDTVGWAILDTMRLFSVNGSQRLLANSSNAESGGGISGSPNATGFTVNTPSPSTTYIYIAIRRGPMKTPTSGTSVLALNTRTGNGSTSTVTGLAFPPDLVWTDTRSNVEGAYMFDKLRGPLLGLRNFDTDVEVNDPQYLQTFGQTGFTYGSNGSINMSARTYIDWCMRRAPSFFDEVCYTGTGATLTVNHNLGVVPELIIFKRRDSAAAWPVWRTATGTGTSFVYLNDASGDADQGTNILTATPTSTSMSVAAWGAINASGGTYVAYLFASTAGVSKVGSYSGTGATQTISCGFAARFVMIKRTDSTGSWWVWDTARGMVAGTDPRIPINSSTAETNANWVYTDASGFQIVTTDTTVNASGGSYIYLAIA